MRLACIAVTLSLLAVAGCLGAGREAPATAPAEQPRGSIPGTSNPTEVVDLAAQGFAEVNLVMEENQTIDYAWATREGDAAGFNIHSHEDGKTTYHAEGSYARTSGTFTAPQPRIYSLMWENPGATPLTIDLDLRGQFQVLSQS
jgi:hypothetical protein